ncbi:hypothetical protein HNR46_004077 [Haloferula luteola]|uniref:Uncharacterized protein n=1 Tax=Haloferula luteola TaxID=595692 RepID=A0A840VE83_9BACT|nr:hypothetical protein [Haloferula luteola]MBB5353814.1 hypothetical protein [Haloferula luteola]
MTSISTLLIALPATAFFAHAENAPSWICVDGDTLETFPLKDEIPEKALLGGWLPEIVEGAQEKSRLSLIWTESPAILPEIKEVGSFQGHPIVELNFSTVADSPSSHEPSKQATILACCTGSTVSSSLMPFLIVTDPFIRYFELIFTESPHIPLHLEVGITRSGNGMIWSALDFEFKRDRAHLVEITSGSRGTRTKIRHFSPQGTPSYIEEVDEN